MTDRKQLAPKYTPDRASMMLAEAELFGDVFVCQKWEITRQTLHRYRSKLCEDDELLQLFTLKRRMLVSDWGNDAVKAIKVASAEVIKRMPIAATEEDAKIIVAISSAAKIFGELHIAMKALEDEPSDRLPSTKA